METYIVYGLVFAAILVAALVVWQMVDAAGLAEERRLDFESASSSGDGRQKTLLERIVSPGRLFRMKLSFALLPGILVPGCFLLAGFSHPVFLLSFGGAAAFTGWSLTRFHYAHLAKRRMAAFEKKILDLTSGLASALKAGMALPQAVAHIAGQMTGPMREELAIVLREKDVGIGIPAAMQRLAERMPCEDMRLLSASVNLTTQTGGSLAEVLAEMTDMIRRRREFADKVKALTMQGRFEGYALGVMPVVAFAVFYLVQPEIMGSLFTTLAGWTAIGVAAAMETVGFIVISKVTNIEV